MIDTTIITLDLALICLFETVHKTNHELAAELGAALSAVADKVPDEIRGEAGTEVQNQLRKLAEITSSTDPSSEVVH